MTKAACGHHGNILSRYSALEAYPRIFARCKLATDPLFNELAKILDREAGPFRTILDIGCGYGLPACWCLERFSEARVIGIEPDPERVRVAGRAVGDRGMILEKAAPELPEDHERFNLILLLDMLHYLDAEQLRQTLSKSRDLLDAGGRLVARFVIKPTGRRRSLYWFIEDARSRRSAGIIPTYYTDHDLRTTASSCGFQSVDVLPSSDPELFWLVCRAD